ncbi:MAG: CDP-alcohol phosphatidyltransferase family protein [Actinoallomurus sp.]
MPLAPLVGLIAQIALLAVLTATTGLGAIGWLAGVAYGVTAAALLGLALHRRGRRSLAPADHITLARATLVGCVTALVADTVRAPAPTALLVSLSAVALALDVVDGRVARRTGTASPLGARFDMEVDAFLLLVLSVFVATSLGAWVLAIGGMRYAFVAAGLRLRWLLAPLQPRRSRSVVAGLQGIVLTTVAADLLPRAVEATATGLALATLVWSFAADIIRLHPNRDMY